MGFSSPCSHRATCGRVHSYRPGCLKQPFWKGTETCQPWCSQSGTFALSAGIGKQQLHRAWWDSTVWSFGTFGLSLVCIGSVSKLPSFSLSWSCCHLQYIYNYIYVCVFGMEDEFPHVSAKTSQAGRSKAQYWATSPALLRLAPGPRQGCCFAQLWCSWAVHARRWKWSRSGWPEIMGIQHGLMKQLTINMT